MNKHRVPGVRALGLVAVVITAIVGLWAGGVAASAASCSDLVLPSNATCNNGTVTLTDGANNMALTVNSYGNTQVSSLVTTNHVATIGVGMSDQNNGDVVAIVPVGSTMGAGVYFYKRTGGTDSLLDSAIGVAGVPAVNQPVTVLVNVYGPSVSVFLNGNLAKTFNDPYIHVGKSGLGSNSAGYPSASAQFSNIIIGGTATITGTDICYDQFGNPFSCACYGGVYTNCGCFNGVYNGCACNNVYGCGCFNSVYGANCTCASFTNGCACWNGTAYQANCVVFNTACGGSFCNYCTQVYGTPVPCQCYNPWGQAISCGCFDGNNFCGCHDGQMFDGCKCQFGWDDTAHHCICPDTNFYTYYAQGSLFVMTNNSFPANATINCVP